MAANIDQIRTRESADHGTTGHETSTSGDHPPDDETRLVRVDVSGISLSAVQSIVRDRASTPVYVEHRAGTTYLVADRDRPIA